MSSKIAPEPGRPWSLAARLTLWFFVSSFALVLAATGYLYLVLAHSLDEEDDHFLSDRTRALLASLPDRAADREALRQQVKWAGATRKETPIYLRILSHDNQTVAETPDMEAVLPRAAFPEAQVDTGAALSGREYRSAGGRWFRILSLRGTINPYSIQAAMDRSHEEELLENYRRNLWIVLGVAVIVCSLGAYLLIRTAIRPVKDIAATAARIHASTLNERIVLGGLPAELRTLGDTFNEMLDRLEQSFQRLSQFSADIAHELRTPLNDLRGEAEVALGRARTPEEYRDVIGSSLEEYGKLARMIDNLLFLARAENPATQIVRETVELGVELARLKEYYEAAAADVEVQLTVSCPAPITARLDRSLVQRAVGNLVENALAHTPPNGTVQLSAARQDGWLLLEVADTGPGIEPAHVPHLFDRFYRADAARRSSKTGNVGLGLAIVKSIAELHGGTAAITSQLGAGTQIVLRLPVSEF